MEEKKEERGSKRLNDINEIRRKPLSHTIINYKETLNHQKYYSWNLLLPRALMRTFANCCFDLTNTG